MLYTHKCCTFLFALHCVLILYSLMDGKIWAWSFLCVTVITCNCCHGLILLYWFFVHFPQMVIETAKSLDKSIVIDAVSYMYYFSALWVYGEEFQLLAIVLMSFRDINKDSHSCEIQKLCSGRFVRRPLVGIFICRLVKKITWFQTFFAVIVISCISTPVEQNQIHINKLNVHFVVCSLDCTKLFERKILTTIFYIKVLVNVIVHLWCIIFVEDFLSFLELVDSWNKTKSLSPLPDSFCFYLKVLGCFAIFTISMRCWYRSNNWRALFSLDNNNIIGK